MTIILGTGWPILIILSAVMLWRGVRFYSRLKDTVIGKIMIPAVVGWMFGLYSVGIVSTAYMLCVPWEYVVIPVFAIFLIVVIVMIRMMKTLETQSLELRSFYKDLEELVEQRTKELEDAHKKAIHHEKELQKLKDQFVFIAAHELRTPVTAINWGLESVLQDPKRKIPKEMKAMLGTVYDSNQRLIKLVEDLLNVARIEAGTIKIEPKEIDVKEVVSGVIEEMESVFEEKPVTLNYSEPKEDIKAYADGDRIKQVLINLLSNATKYNLEKGTIDLSVIAEDGFAKIEIKDSGIGIKKEDMEKLFTKFGRVQGLETQDIPGTGLGLFLSKQIVELSGGEIYAESKHGKGSTFTFTIPLTKELYEKNKVEITSPDEEAKVSSEK